MTEEEWIRKWNESAHNQIFMCNDLRAVSGVSELQMVIDSGATHTVVGSRWFEFFKAVGNHSPCTDSTRTFKFGDSRVFTSRGRVKLTVFVPTMAVSGINVQYVRCHFHCTVLGWIIMESAH